MKRFLCAGVALTMLLAGCGTPATEQGSGTESTDTTLLAEDTQNSAELHGVIVQYDAEDTNTAWDDSAVAVSCAGTSAKVSGTGVEVKDGTLTITAAGTYVFSGDFTGQLVVDTDKKSVVHVFFNGFTITNDKQAPVNFSKAKKVVVTLVENTKNTVTDGKEYVFEEDQDEPDAALYSKCDLTFNGTGSLTVNGNYKHGIHSKDRLAFLSGTYCVNAATDAIKGKDSVSIRGGTFAITSGEDGIKSNNAKDENCGWIVIDGGTFDISAGDDGMHAETNLSIHNGTININSSVEGLEGQSIDIDGGKISVKATDDAVNAAEASESGSTEQTGKGGMSRTINEKVYIHMYGGVMELEFTGQMGDCLDANGAIGLYGGTVYISAGNVAPVGEGESGIDADGTITFDGGTVVSCGKNGGIARMTSNDYTGNVILVWLDNAVDAGTKLTLTDADNKTICTYAPTTQYGGILLSAPELKTGETYTLTIGEDTQEITLSDAVTTVGTAADNGFGDMGERPTGGRPTDDRMPMSGATPSNDASDPAQSEA